SGPVTRVSPAGPLCRRAYPAKSEPEIFPEALGLGPADRNLRRLRVSHPEDVIPAEPGHDLLDLVDVDQMRPVHPPEGVRVEVRLELVERPIVRDPRQVLR